MSPPSAYSIKAGLTGNSYFLGLNQNATQSDSSTVFNGHSSSTFTIGNDSAVNNKSGVVGFDEEHNNKLLCIDFNRIKGGKPFDTKSDWFLKLMNKIDQIN